MTRWTLTDPTTNEVWEMPINPDKMTSPFRIRSLKTRVAVRINAVVADTSHTIEAKPAPVDWEWQGVIRSEAHYEAYVDWAERPGLVRVHDHLDRTWEVMIESFVPEERRPSARTDWRFRYTVKCLILRRIA